MSITHRHNYGSPEAMMSETQIKTISFGNLLRRLQLIRYLDYTSKNTFETQRSDSMVTAQQLLGELGYALNGWDIHSYILYYSPEPKSLGTKQINLHYIGAQSRSHVALALVYQEDGVLKRFEAGSSVRHGHRHTMQRIEDEFRYVKPSTEFDWIPIFDGHWPIVSG